MKRPFNLSAITADLPTLPEEDSGSPEAARSSFPAVPIARAIETQHRNAMSELKALEASIERSKEAGLVIEEIDPALADPSPYWDRDMRFLEDPSFAEFREDVRRQGQQSPALLRPHPTEPGRFETCFGHRRLFACRALGIKLRAVVQRLSEAQMAGAAYSENTHRQGVSILEQSRALSRYIDRGVFPSKQALADALNVSRSHISNLTSYAEIPENVLKALGDWRKCTFREAIQLLKASRDAVQGPLMIERAAHLIAEEPDLGFAARLKLLLGRNTDSPAEKEELLDAAGRKIAAIKRGKGSVTLSFTSQNGEELAELVWARLPAMLGTTQKSRRRKS